MTSQLFPFTSPPPQPPRFTSPTNHHDHLRHLTKKTYIPPHIYTHPTAILLELCTSLTELHQILPLIIKQDLYNELLFQTKLVSLFCNYNSLSEAVRVFEPIEDKRDALYHTLLKGYAKNSSLLDSFNFFTRMRVDNVMPVVYNFTYMLKLCGDNCEIKKGKELHGMLLTNGLWTDLYAMTAIMNMYAKCRQIDDAYRVFERMPERDLVCWNAIISGYAQNGFARRALDLFSSMFQEGQSPDSITVISVLPAIADLRLLTTGKGVHGLALRGGFENRVNVSTALVDMYSKCGNVKLARQVFDRMTERSVVSWNSMIDGYAQSGNAAEAMVMFEKMMAVGVQPSNVSVMGALHACADLVDLERGKFVHKVIDLFKLDADVSVMNSLISMYSKCKSVDAAADIFKNLQNKTLVSWNAMILGYAQNGLVNEALNAFRQMHSENMKPDSFTMVSVIPALAELSIPSQAKWIHGLVIRKLLDRNVFVMTALVDMYAKCGAISTAKKLFDMIDDRHVITWNAMIDGYGTHGLGREAIELFKEMQKGITKPNDVTFLCVISACSHSGLVEEGLHYFDSMSKDYGLEPAMDHYGAMVDLLGRAGRLNEAWDFIQKMPVEPKINVYGAMLGACKIHKNVKLGEKAASKIFELNPDDGGYHVLLANIYAAASMWDKVAEVRTTMQKTGIQKTPGCSLVEAGNEIHRFYSGTTNHPESEKVYSYLETLVDKIKAAGYVPDTNSIHDVEADVKEQLLNTHSEKLAIAFGLLNTSNGTPIHVRKNLRVCGDCHNATKYISLVTGREIIVRDMHRFHHFNNGMCSCGDYW